jgi:hypothetical protein
LILYNSPIIVEKKSKSIENGKKHVPKSIPTIEWTNVGKYKK